MDALLKFFLKVSDLKRIQRTGWRWLGVKNPETIAEHSFRTAFLAWLVGSSTHLRVSKMIAMSLFHDICEVYAGDLTPYYGILPNDAKKRKEILKRWIRIPQNKKISLARRKFLIEKAALVKLLKHLGLRTRKDIFELWLEYEKGLSKEGKFVKQIDKIEALLQAIEYFGTGPNTPVIGWWEEVEELVDHPTLLRFLKGIEQKFYKKKRSEFERALEFLGAIGKLKRMPQSGWVIRNVKNPDSVANHTFMVSVMSFVIAREKLIPLNYEKLLKLALVHQISAPYLKRKTPYDVLLRKAKTENERRKILQKWIRCPLPAKRSAFLKNYRAEKMAVWKLTSPLECSIRSEIRTIWKEFRQNQTKEARFVNQIHVLELLLQAFHYYSKDKKFPMKAWWEWAFEFSDTPINLEFFESLKKVSLQAHPFDKQKV